MTTKIGSMIVDFKARTASLEDGLRKTRKELAEVKKGGKRTSQSFDGMTTALKRFAGPVAIGAAVAGMTMMVKRQAAVVDQTKKFADRIGVATERLIALHHAGSLAGVTAQAMNMSLQRMTRRIAEAAQGTGEAVKGIKELGLSARALNQLAPDKQFEAVAAAMAKIPNRADQVRLAMKLFDSEGVAVLNTLDALAKDGLASAVAETKRLGLAITDLDAANIEAMNDALTRASAASEGMARQFTVGIAPAIAQIANSSTDMADGFSWARMAGEALGSMFKGLSFMAAGLTNQVIGMLRSVVQLANEPWQIMQALIKKAQALPAALGAIADAAFTIITNPIDSIRKFAAEFIESLAGAVAGLLERARPAVEALFGKDALGKIDTLQVEVWKVGRTFADSVEGGANEASETIDTLAIKFRQAFAGSAVGEQAGIPMLQGLDEQLAGAVAKIKAFMIRIADPAQSPVPAPQPEAGGEGAQAAGGSNMWLTMMGMGKQAQVQAWGEWQKWKFKMLKAGRDAQIQQKEQEQKILMQRIENTQNWANATFDTMRALGGKSLANNKTFAIGEALVNTALGITKTFAYYGGTPAGWAAAAAIGASGAAQIAAISSASPGGGGATFAGANTTGPVATANDTSGIPTANQGRDINVTISIPKHGYVPPETAMAFADAIDQLKKDGY